MKSVRIELNGLCICTVPEEMIREGRVNLNDCLSIEDAKCLKREVELSIRTRKKIGKLLGLTYSGASN